MSEKRVIWKYKMYRPGPDSVSMPVGATPVHFGIQDHMPMLWCEIAIDGEIERECRTFEIVGTGHDVPPDAVYVGTCVDGPWVWHLYERPGDAAR